MRNDRHKPNSDMQLTDLLDQIQSATMRAGELMRGRSKADLSQRPDPDTWSVAECFDHLAQTTRAFLPAIAEAISSAQSLSDKRALRTGAFAALVVRKLEPPYRLRMQVLAQIAPKQTDIDAAWNGFVESQNQLLETVRSAAGLAIDKVKVQSPVYARISYNVYGALCIIAAHERRHIWQAEQICKAKDRKQATDNVAHPLPQVAHASGF